MNKNKGFTLVELLLVISIIALLSSIFISSLQTSRVKAAEAANAEQGRQLKTALELSRSSNGSLPSYSGFIGKGTGVYEELVPESIPEIPNIEKAGQCSQTIGERQYISDGKIARDGSAYYRCGPGNTPDPYVIYWIERVGVDVPESERLNISFNSPSGPYGAMMMIGDCREFYQQCLPENDFCTLTERSCNTSCSGYQYLRCIPSN